MAGVTRVTVSIPDDSYCQLESIITAGKWNNRSQAIAQLIRDEYLEISAKRKKAIMAGSITLFYNEAQREILPNVAEVQRENINEVISTNRVLLENNHVMEILVVQGFVDKLEEIQQQFLKIKGVVAGKLVLTSIILPPIHSK
jgi:CopG family nickel-responsive transcriptional regulator